MSRYQEVCNAQQCPKLFKIHWYQFCHYLSIFYKKCSVATFPKSREHVLFKHIRIERETISFDDAKSTMKRTSRNSSRSGFVEFGDTVRTRKHRSATGNVDIVLLSTCSRIPVCRSWFSDPVCNNHIISEDMPRWSVSAFRIATLFDMMYFGMNRPIDWLIDTKENNDIRSGIVG